MVRPLAMLTGLGLVVAALWSFLWSATAYISSPPVATAEQLFHREPKEVSFSFDGPFGKYDHAQLQRGFKVYKEVCAACHSMKLVAFRDLRQIDFSDAQVKAIAKSWPIEAPSIDPKTGEPATRKALPADHFPPPYPNAVAAAAANNNAVPPDQSLLAKAREGGPHYIYSLLTGYEKQPAALLRQFPDVKTPPGLHYNPYFANLNLAMAPPLTSGQVTFDDGSPNTIDHEAKDVAAFLMWAAEPKLNARHAAGLASVVFLMFFTGLAYLAYKSIWADKKKNL